jgi:hypothetical protein
MKSAYDDYLITIGKKFTSLFSEIKADYNFDNGHEFEIAVCNALRLILPSKYGICRGTVFTIDNKTAGDDIIIYDHWQFPTLRLLDNNNYAQKQRIPIEAVVAYIEAKNTIILEDGEGNSLNKAVQQTTEIKRLGRKEMPLNPFVCEIDGLALDFQMQKEYPQINNPLYTCIFSRGVRERKYGQILDSQTIFDKLRGQFLSCQGKCPDLLILNDDIIVFPIIGNVFHSPFYLENIAETHFQIFNKKEMAWGIGISLLFLAFERIRLGSIDWKGIIAQTLKMTDKRDGNPGGHP